MVTNKNPIISVILPVFNADKYLETAIDSILNQTFADFEFIIIDDGSTDKSAEIILLYANKDSRIKAIKNLENRGLIYTLNKGLAVVKGKYIARMDADDRSYPDRFKIQFEFLESNPDISLVGSNYNIIGHQKGQSALPTNPEEIDLLLYFRNVIAHPTVMMRAETLKENNLQYDHQALHLEDWALWLDLKKHCKMANLEACLLDYRIEGQNISIKNKSTKEVRSKFVLGMHLVDVYKDELTDDMLSWHWKLAYQIYDNEKVDEIYQQIKNLKRILLLNTDYSQFIIRKVVSDIEKSYFYKISDASTLKGLKFLIISKNIDLKSFRYVLGKLITKK